MGFDAADFERILKLLALVQQGTKAITEILANKSTQGGMIPSELFDRAEEHTKEALDIIDKL